MGFRSKHVDEAETWRLKSMVGAIEPTTMDPTTKFVDGGLIRWGRCLDMASLEIEVERGKLRATDYRGQAALDLVEDQLEADAAVLAQRVKAETEALLAETAQLQSEAQLRLAKAAEDAGGAAA